MHLNLAKAQELIGRAISEKGEEYIYPHSSKSEYGSDCKYVEINDDPETNAWDYVPSCIVGHAFVSAGVEAEEIYDSGYNGSGASILVEYLMDTDALTGYDDDALAYLGRVQNSQDRGRPWGEAAEEAAKGKSWDASKQAYVQSPDSYYL